MEQAIGRPYADQIAANYRAALAREDYAGVRDYDRVLLGKLVADKTQVDVVNTDDAVAARQTAFAEALQALTGIRQETK